MREAVLFCRGILGSQVKRERSNYVIFDLSNLLNSSFEEGVQPFSLIQMKPVLLGAN